MNRQAILVAVALVFFFPLGIWGQEKADKAKADGDNQIDKKVVEFCKRTGELYKNAKTLHAEGKLVSTFDNNGEKRQMNVAVVYDVERPNRLSLRTTVDGDSTKGPDVIVDGKELTVHRKARKQYLEEDAPDNLGEIGLRVLRVGPAMTGMLFGNILADDPAELLMQGVNSCS